MANNLRYLLEHFCLDGQTIDISSKLDEENAEKIEKINNEKLPNINKKIEDIENTTIPELNSKIDNIKNSDIPSINTKINTINNTTIPNVIKSVNDVDKKVDSTNLKVNKNTNDISSLSENITNQGNSIGTLKNETIPTLEKEITNIKKVDETQNSDITNLKEWKTATDIIMSGFQSDISNLQNDKLDSETFNSTMSSISSSLTQQGGEINVLQTNVTRLDGKIQQNTSDISDNQSNIKGLSKNVEGLTTKVNDNSDSINTINNTSIPNLQSQIDNLSSGGSGSIEDLREKVQTNSTDISTINKKVDKNTTDISTINATSIPELQNQINNLKSDWTETELNITFQAISKATLSAKQIVNKKLKIGIISISGVTTGSSPSGGYVAPICTLSDNLPTHNVIGTFMSTVKSPQGGFLINHTIGNFCFLKETNGIYLNNNADWSEVYSGAVLNCDIFYTL